MKITDKVEGNIAVITPKGRIMGGPDASLMHDKIWDYIDKGTKKIIFNLENVEWINATGLGILMSALKTIRDNGGELILCLIPEEIESLLTKTKLITEFKTFDSEEQALKHFE